MTGITDPAEEYFKDGIWAWDATAGAWVKLLADDNGYLKVAEQSPITGFATSANQTTMITALQLIDDLRAALNSVATDELDVVIDGQNADVEVTQTAAADLTPGVCGWDGSAWRKLPMVWGYSDRYIQHVEEIDVPAGTRSLNFSPVSAGEVWRVVSFSARASTNNPVSVVLGVVVSAVFHHLYRVSYPTADLTVNFPGEIILKEADYLQARFYTCVLNDDIYADAVGYKMKIAE